MSELKIRLLELLHDDAFLTKDKLAVMLGKEEKEVETAINAGVKTVTLGKRILRTETAASAVLPIIMYENDEMQ